MGTEWVCEIYNLKLPKKMLVLDVVISMSENSDVSKGKRLPSLPAGNPLPLVGVLFLFQNASPPNTDQLHHGAHNYQI